MAKSAYREPWCFTDGFVVTPSDSLLISQDPNNTSKTWDSVQLLVTVTGNVKFVTVEGTTITLSAVPANFFTPLPWAVKQVLFTGTSATLVACASKGPR